MVTIREESCREPESKLCGNQKAILALLNLPAPFITAAREEARREGRKNCTEGKICGYNRAKGVFQSVCAACCECT